MTPTPRIRADLYGVVSVVNADGHAQLLRAGDAVPEGYAAGPHVLEQRDGQTATPDQQTTPAPTSTADSATTQTATDAAAVTEPPRAGKGSGIGAWREYAAHLGIDVPEGATRDEVIALVDHAADDGDE